jgi:hypothetical protein
MRFPSTPDPKSQAIAGKVWAEHRIRGRTLAVSYRHAVARTGSMSDASAEKRGGDAVAYFERHYLESVQDMMTAYGLDLRGYYRRLASLLDSATDSVRLSALKLLGTHLGLDDSAQGKVGTVIQAGAIIVTGGVEPMVEADWVEMARSTETKALTDIHKSPAE